MGPRTAVVLAALALSVATACDGTDPADDHPSTTPAPAAPSALPLGKSDLPVVAGPYRSPDGFAPVLDLEVPDGWTSVHRASDAFDLGMPDPARDAPLVAVVFLRPKQRSTQDVLATLRRHANGAVRPAHGRVGDIPATVLDVTGGRGELIASADGGIALDAAPGQRARVLVADVGGAPLVVVVLVPDGRLWSTAYPAARTLLGGTRAA